MVSFDSRKRLGLSQDGNFRNQIKVALLKAATDIVGETPVSPAKDVKRHDLGTVILSPNGIEKYITLFAEVCASRGTLTTTSTDADVEFTVTSVWDDIAGVSGAEA